MSTPPKVRWSSPSLGRCAALAAAGAILQSTVLLCADDAVVVASAKSGAPNVTRTGTIVDYTGAELKLELAGGRVEGIPAERVREVRTTYSEGQRTADRLLGEGKSEAAATAYRAARQAEPRAWVKRRITAQLVGIYTELGRIDAAGDEYLTLLAADPDSLHFAVIPLPWKTLALDASMEARAQAWMRNDKSAAARLLGASWLLPSADRGPALQTLTKLTDGPDKRAAVLADWQLWRTKIVTAKREDVLRRQEQFERLDESLRPAVCYALGEGWARVNEPDAAAAAFMQLPVLYPQQRGAAADALLAAGRQLEKIERLEQAAGLYREVLSRFPASETAAECRVRLDSQTTTKEKTP